MKKSVLVFIRTEDHNPEQSFKKKNAKKVDLVSGILHSTRAKWQSKLLALILMKRVLHTKSAVRGRRQLNVPQKINVIKLFFFIIVVIDT